jgi:methionyl-tRNA synthetase
VTDSTSDRLRRELVTAAPPTPNGDLHLGHLSGPYLGGDVYARARRLQGIDAHFIFGSDDNTIYVKTCGRGLGLSPEETAARFTDAIEETLAMAGIELAAFPRPNASPHHRRLTREFFRVLYDRGALVEKTEPAPWCDGCERHLFEAYVRGRCPYCGDAALGQTCEGCGRVYDARRVAEGVCSQCGAAPSERPLRRLVFPLAEHEGFLREYSRRAEIGPHLRSLIDSVLADGAPDVAVTHPTDWGIEIPVEGWEDQRIYVWFEMAPRYFAYAEHVNDAQGVPRSENGWRRFWKSDDARVVQFFGYDNGFYYGLLLPALFQAFDPDLNLPAGFVTNEFFRLDGLKFSTTRDHRIMGRDLLAEAPRDPVRFYLAWAAPEQEQTNFTRESFHATVRGELLESWGGWLDGLFRRLADDFDGTVPALAPAGETDEFNRHHERFLCRLEELREATAGAYSLEGFSPQRATRVMSELVREARRFGSGERHWDGVPGREGWRSTGAALEALAAKLLAVLAAPVMPAFAASLWVALGFSGEPSGGDWHRALDAVPTGQRIAPPPEWFPGLDRYLASVAVWEEPVVLAGAAGG